MIVGVTVARKAKLVAKPRSLERLEAAVELGIRRGIRALTKHRDDFDNVRNNDFLVVETFARTVVDEVLEEFNVEADK